MQISRVHADLPNKIKAWILFGRSGFFISSLVILLDIPFENNGFTVYK